jgi:hypothetical protein
MKKESILDLRKRAEAELFVLFGVPREEITESAIMYLVGCYQTGVDTVELAASMIAKDYEEIYPSQPGNDVEEETEEEKAKRRWEKMK